MDFGSILGSDNHPMPRQAIAPSTTKGLWCRSRLRSVFPQGWARANYPKIKGVGLFSLVTRPDFVEADFIPTRLFLRMDPERVLGRETGRCFATLVAPCVEAETATQAQRRYLAEEWFSQILPLDKFQVVNGKLKFEDLGENRGNRKARQSPCAGQFGTVADATTKRDRHQDVLRSYRDLAATVERRDMWEANPRLRQGQTGLEVVGIDR